MYRYSQLHTPGDGALPGTQEGLLSRIIEDSLTAAPADMQDIEYRSQSLKDFIKTGFR